MFYDTGASAPEYVTSAPEVGAELKKLGRDVHSALQELRNATDTKNHDTARRVESFMHKYTNEAEKYARQVAEAQK